MCAHTYTVKLLWSCFFFFCLFVSLIFSSVFVCFLLDLMFLGCAMGLQERYVAPDAALFSSLFGASGFPEGDRLSCLLLKPALHTSAAC